jgi:hypothetical protein
MIILGGLQALLNAVNIILDDPLVLHLTSSGLRKIAKTVHRTLLGTRGFLAEEVLASGRRSPESHVLAFGTILHPLFSDIPLSDSVRIRIRVLSDVSYDHIGCW